MPEKLPTVAIVGRPNVGKSSIFNSVIGRRKAIVHEQSGVTRDRVVTRATWNNRPFMMIDTGGLGFYREQQADDIFDELIRDQLLLAVESADVIILVTDASSGVNPLDQEVANLLRPFKRRVIVAANKADNPQLQEKRWAFDELGFDEITAVSTVHNFQVIELFDSATKDFPEQADVEETPPLQIAVVGRPNVGKSSIVNRLFGEDRVMVSDIAGTTRDAIDVPVVVETPDGPRPVTLVDTAGLRRKSRIDTVVELFSMHRTQAAIKRADFVIMVLDGREPVTAQDKKIAALITKAAKPCLIVANKWDEAGKEMNQKALFEEIYRLMPFFRWAEIIPTCALSGYNLSDLLVRALHRADRQNIQVPTSLVNEFVRDLVARQPPPAMSTGRLKIYYGVHVKQSPPTFLLFVNNKKLAASNYLSYMEKQFRHAFELDGLPVKLEVRNRRAEDYDRAPPPEVAEAMKLRARIQRNRSKKYRG